MTRRVAPANLVLQFGLLAILAYGPRLTAQHPAPTEETTFSEETEVVAIDRMVGLKGAAGWLRGGKLPKSLDLSDFKAWAVSKDETVGEARVELTSVVLEKVVRGLPETTLPWRVVVLVDSALASTRTVRWALGLLAERAEGLTSLGEVTVSMASAELTAGPSAEPRTVLLPTRDAAAVREMLSRLALLAEGDDSVLDGRWRWVEGGGGNATRTSEDEVLELRRALDARLLHLTEAARDSGARRLLLWITDGFDLAPSEFYGTDLPPADLLAGHARDVFRALSADGWVALSLRPPDEDPYRGRDKGVRIGRWRVFGLPFLFAGVHEEERDPDRSEAYLELGDQRLASGDVEGAADSYDRAYYHYWSDPATSDRQAVALLRLADCLQTLGDHDGARRARGMAVELDPEVASRHLTVDSRDPARPEVARLLDPEAPLRLLAQTTSGAVLAHRRDFDDQVFDLHRRLRLTVQLPAELAKGLHRIEITWRGEPVRAPEWVRVGHSIAVDEARRRRAGKK